jgi:adenylate cyclase
MNGWSWRRAATAAGLGIAATACAVVAGLLPIARTLDWKLYDLHVRRAADPSRARRDIVLVTIDERSLRALDPLVGRWPWPRVVHSYVIDFLARAPARVVAYDVLFGERDRVSGYDLGGQQWSGAESDQALVDSVRRAGNVVLLADATFEGVRNESHPSLAGQPPAAAPGDAPRRSLPPGLPLDGTFEVRPDMAPPFADLAEAALGIGHNYLVLDPDGPVRRIVPYLQHAGGLVPSFGLATFLAAGRIPPGAIRLDGGVLEVGPARVPMVRDRLPRFEADPASPRDVSASRMLLAFRGPAVLADGRTTTYRRVSFYDVFYSEQQVIAGDRPFVDPATFRDAIVFVGVTAAGLHDVFVSPFGESGKMPGSQVHASLVDQLLSRRFVRPASRGTVAQVTALVALLAAAAFTFLAVRPAAFVLALLLAGVTATSFAIFTRGVWLPLVTPLLGAALAGVAGIAYRYAVEGREKRAVKRLFSRYLSRDVYEQVLANPALAELGGSRRDMSVLFSDIRGFTAVTEQGDPEPLVEQLNQYFSRMVDVVFAHRGTLDKFVGDMVMALFGAPLDDPRHADHAVQAALAMLDALDELNARWRAQGRPALDIGIGINSGEMIAGNIGAETIRSYTAIGDHVNLGSRLESLNKEYGTSIIISEHTARRLAGRYDLRPLGEVVVKGKSVAVAIHEVRRTAAAPARDVAALGPSTQEGRQA